MSTSSSAAHHLYREAVTEIPVIDISPFLRHGNPASKAATAETLRKACIDVGFFYLSGHGFPTGDLNEAGRQALRFFELPLHVKMRYRAKMVGGTGFVRIGGMNPDASAGERADVKERFIAIRNTSSSGEEACWPDEQALPGFAAFMQHHIALRVSLALTLSRALSMSLHLPETYLDDYYRSMSHNMLLNYYPPLSEAALARNQWSFSPHTDYGGFTLLSQDSIGGLQVLNAGGQWIDVPPRDEQFVVNIGDLTAMWTNDLYKSTLHRAANISGLARVSIPFFVSPNRSAAISTLETCISESNPSRYSSVTAGDYLNKMISTADTTGLPGISDRTADRLKVH